MSTVKLKYVGHAPVVTLTIPLDASRKLGQKLVLLQGQEFELDKSEAEKLLERDKKKETVFEDRAVQVLQRDGKTFREEVQRIPVQKTTNEQNNFELAGGAKKTKAKDSKKED